MHVRQKLTKQMTKKPTNPSANSRRCQLGIFKGSHVATRAHFIFYKKEPWRGVKPAIFGEKYAFMCAGLEGLGRWTAPTEEIFLFGWRGSSLKHLKHLKLWDSEMVWARTCLQHICSARVHTRFRQSSSYTWDLKLGLEHEVPDSLLARLCTNWTNFIYRENAEILLVSISKFPVALWFCWFELSCESGRVGREYLRLWRINQPGPRNISTIGRLNIRCKLKQLLSLRPMTRCLWVPCIPCTSPPGTQLQAATPDPSAGSMC